MDFTSKEREYLDTHPYKIEQLCNIAKDKPIIKLPITIIKAFHLSSGMIKMVMICLHMKFLIIQKKHRII